MLIEHNNYYGYTNSLGIISEDDPEKIIQEHTTELGDENACVHDIAAIVISDEDYMLWKLTDEIPPELRRYHMRWE